jgi:hypothetical protein
MARELLAYGHARGMFKNHAADGIQAIEPPAGAIHEQDSNAGLMLAGRQW